MFSFIRKAKILIPFFYERLGDYGELGRMDLVQFRNETVRAIAGAMIAAAALLLLLCFVGIAAIVTEWDTPHRVLTAWLVVLLWGLCGGACVHLARRLMRGSPPFANIGSAISSDLKVIKDPELNNAERGSR
jgi:fatty acid desaturase